MQDPKTRDVIIGTRGSRLALWQANHIAGSTVLRDQIRAPVERATEAGTILAERIAEKGAAEILDEIRLEQ